MGPDPVLDAMMRTKKIALVTLASASAALTLQPVADFCFCAATCMSPAHARVAEPKIPRKPDQCDLPFTTLAKGPFSGIKTAERLAITEENSWLCVWNQHSSSSKKALRVAPHVDFDKSMVVAVFQGEKSSRSGMIQIDRIKLMKDRVVVIVNENLQTASKGTRPTTHAYHIVRLAKNSLPVVFH